MFFIIWLDSSSMQLHLAGLIVYAAAHNFRLLYVGALRAASVDASSNETQAAALDNHSGFEHGVIRISFWFRSLNF
jgi:hypothetical protein